MKTQKVRERFSKDSAYLRKVRNKYYYVFWRGLTEFNIDAYKIKECIDRCRGTIFSEKSSDWNIIFSLYRGAFKIHKVYTGEFCSNMGWYMFTDKFDVWKMHRYIKTIVKHTKREN